MTYGAKPASKIRVSKIPAQWVNVEADQVEDFQNPPMPSPEQRPSGPLGSRN
jgi:hypothetical protein